MLLLVDASMAILSPFLIATAVCTLVVRKGRWRMGWGGVERAGQG